MKWECCFIYDFNPLCLTMLVQPGKNVKYYYFFSSLYFCFDLIRKLKEYKNYKGLPFSSLNPLKLPLSQEHWGSQQGVQNAIFLNRIRCKKVDEKTNIKANNLLLISRQFLKVRQSRNAFFQADDSSKKRTNKSIFFA